MFENSKERQGTTSVVPQSVQKVWGFSPCGKMLQNKIKGSKIRSPKNKLGRPGLQGGHHIVNENALTMVQTALNVQQPIIYE
jgi:hypothetical protein